MMNEYARKILLSLLLFVTLPVLHGEEFPRRALEINIFSLANGKGLENSRKIFGEALVSMGHKVSNRELNDKNSGNTSNVDLNIFFEDIAPDWFSKAQENWFIPNPEIKVKDFEKVRYIDLILCRTYESKRIYEALGKTTYFMGFTSLDCLHTETAKDYFSCLHAPGNSPYKGTKAVVKAWNGDLELPPLTLVTPKKMFPLNQQNVAYIHEKLPLEPYRSLQNQHGIHICVSETEGFGHYLVEAMSAGSVVVTTDAPPMNEYIQDRRCLVPYKSKKKLNLADSYEVDPVALKKVVKTLANLTEEELKDIGEANRLHYLEMKENFKQNLQMIIDKYLNL